MELARRAGSAVLRPGEIGRVSRNSISRGSSRTETNGRRDTIKQVAGGVARVGETGLRGDWEFLRWPICFTSVERKFTEFGAKHFRRCGDGFANAATLRRRRSAARLPRLPARARRGHLRRSDRARERIAAASRSRAGAFAKKIFASFSMKRRTRIRRNFPFCSKSTRPPEATGHWMETQDRSTATRPFLHGRRFPAIDLSATAQT